MITDAGRRNVELNHAEASDATAGQLGLLYWQQGNLPELLPLLDLVLAEQPYLHDAFVPVRALALAQDGRDDEARGAIDALRLSDLTTAPPSMRTLTMASSSSVRLGRHDTKSAVSSRTSWPAT